MDQISVESSDSQNSSCSYVSYEGTDGDISDGQDPFVQPIELQSQPQQEPETQKTQSDESQRSQSISGEKTEAEYQQKRKKRQKEIQYKQIINQLKFGRNTTLLLNKNPLIPTYEQVSRTIRMIKDSFPKRSLENIITRLHYQLVLKPKEIERQQKIRQRQLASTITILSPQQSQKRQKWLAQRRVTAMAFVELGYGITKMRKFIQQFSLNMEIDISIYDEIIIKLLKDAYQRLIRFLRKKCHKKIIKITTPIQQKFLLQLLKNCRHKLDSFEIHNFFKLIKPTYIKNEKFKLSKRIASRIYHTCKEYISRKKVKIGLVNLDNPDCEIYNNDKAKWTDKMIETAVNLYIRQASLNRVREIMSKTTDVDEILIDTRNIKFHIANKVTEGIQIIKKCIKARGSETQGPFSIKDMIDLTEDRISQIINHINATNVRVILLEIYQIKQPTLVLLNQAILAVNQFILKRDNQKMLQEIKRTDRQFNPHEHQFKRRRRSKRR